MQSFARQRDGRSHSHAQFARSTSCRHYRQQSGGRSQFTRRTGVTPMKFSFSDEQQEFRSVLRRFLHDRSPTTEVRRLMATEEGRDAEVWQGLSRDLGLTGIRIPEAYGGQGFGISELAIAVEEMGRALLCAPYFASTVLAATAVLKVGSGRAEEGSASENCGRTDHCSIRLHGRERAMGCQRCCHDGNTGWG